MKARRHFVLLAVVLSLATSGCDWFHRKKPNVPQQAQAPTITQPAPAPAPAPETAQQTPPQPQPGPSKPVDETASKPKPKPARPTTAKKPEPPKPVEQAKAQPPTRIVIQEGGVDTGTPQAPTTTHTTTTDPQRTTQQLLDATDNNLRGLTRALSPDEKAMVEQIRAYMQQSRDASKDGDVVRAHNLALKAHLLSDELVKP